MAAETGGLRWRAKSSATSRRQVARRDMGRKHGTRAKRTPSPEWLAFQAQLIHPDQIAYEEVRPVVALHQPIKERAAEIGVAPRTLSRRVEQFIKQSVPGLVATAARRPDDGRLPLQAVRAAAGSRPGRPKEGR